MMGSSEKKTAKKPRASEKRTWALFDQRTPPSPETITRALHEHGIRQIRAFARRLWRLRARDGLAEMIEALRSTGSACISRQPESNPAQKLKLLCGICRLALSSPFTKVRRGGKLLSVHLGCGAGKKVRRD